MNNKKFVYALVAGIVVFYLPRIVLAQQQMAAPEISQVFRSIVEINDPSAIEMIINDLLLTEVPEDTERIEIIDVSNIGFGADDVLIFYPSRNFYLIDQYSPTLTSMMREWSIEERRRDAESNLGAEYFYPAHADTLEPSEIDETPIELVENSLISDILVSLERNYNDLPISLRFERNEDAIIFQMWNYNEDAFAFSPRPPGVADSVAVNDFLYVLYSDSTVVADTTMYDILYINKTIEETIYTPPVERLEQRIQTQTLPGADSFPPSGLSSQQARKE